MGGCKVECGYFREWLHPWVDGELDLVRGLEMERHLQDCTACLAEYTALRELHSRLSQADLRFRAPAGLEAKIRGLVEAEYRHPMKAAIVLPEVRPETGPRSVPRFFRSVPVAWAAALCALILISFALLEWERMGRGKSDLEALGQELVDSHFRSLQASHLVDVASTDQHTVKPWFAGKIDFSPPVEDLANFGFPLIGGRLDYIRRHPAAALVYKRNLHTINLYCWPDREMDGKGIFHSLHQGYHILIWKDGDFAWGAVSDLNETELRQFAHFLRAPK
jgi:anti-sigma factor RsiW